MSSAYRFNRDRDRPPGLSIRIPQRFTTAGLLLPIVLVAFCSWSESVTPPAVQWQRLLGGDSWESAWDVVELADGGFLVGAQSYSEPGGGKSSPHFGDYDYWVVRLDRSGNQLWDRSFGGSDQESFRALVGTVDGFALAGRSFSPTSGNKTAPHFGGADFWIVRTDIEGNKLWDRSFGGEQWDECTSILATPDGGFLAGGWSSSARSGNKTAPNRGSRDFWAVRLDGSGNKLWDESFGGTEIDELMCMALAEDGGFVLAGLSASRHSASKSSPLYGQTDFWMVRLSPGGGVLWDQSYGGTGSDEAWGIVLTPDKGFAIAGWSDSPPATGNKTAAKFGITDGWIVRTDAQGNKIWDQSAGSTSIDSSDYFWSIELTADGGFIVAGGSEGPVDSFYLDAWAVRFGREGNPLWHALLGPIGQWNRFFAVRQARDGGFLLAGDFDAFGNDAEARLLKLMPDSLTRPPRLTALPQRDPDNGFRLCLSGCSNATYKTEASADLIHWFPVQTNLLSSSQQEIIDCDATNHIRRVYRATILAQ